MKGKQNRDMQYFIDENAKLRLLIENMSKTLLGLDVDYCAGCPYDNINYPCPMYTIGGGECKYVTAMRELGIEVE